MTRKMKDSGIEWIGEIPEDWETKRIQWGLTEVIKKNNPVKAENILSLTKDKGVIPYEDKGNLGNKSKTNLADYKLAYRNSIVMNSMNVIIGSVGLSNYFGCVSPVYYVFKAEKDNDIRFFNYIFQMPVFQSILKKYANGILEIRLRVSSNDVLKRNIPFPNYKKQIKISNYLDKKTKQIEDIKNKISEEIENLENYKKSVITEAVTKGLDKNVEMKDSGIEWIGEIPKHWSIKTIKSITTKSERGTSPSYVDDNTKSKVVNQATFSQGVFDKTNIKYSIIPASQSKGLLQKGDVLLASTGGGVLGKTHYFMENDEYVADGHVTILRTNPAIQNNKILFYIFSTNYELINGLLAKGSTNQTELQSGWLKNFKVPYAPIEEQIRIVNHLDKKCKLIDDSIAIKQKQLETLEEYKKSLIYEYVTGKKEVKDDEET